MTDYIILIFEMTLQLTIGRETFNIKDSSEYAGHGTDLISNRETGKGIKYFKSYVIELYGPHDILDFNRHRQ
jgi:hypothetical protein